MVEVIVHSRDGKHIEFKVCKDKYRKYHAVNAEMEIVFTEDTLSKCMDKINGIA